MNIINVSGDLPGFIAELTSKHTSFEWHIDVDASVKVVFKPFLLMSIVRKI